MKIKLNRPLWNHKSGEIVEASENFSNWAIDRGYAELVEADKPFVADKSIPENKAIEPKYIRNK